MPQELPSEHLRRLGGLNPAALVRLGFDEAPAPEPLEVPGYEIGESLGRGGMGEVFRARQVSLNREVAVKVLHSGLGAAGWLPERFEREAHTMAALRHPSLVTIHDCVRLTDSRIAIVMELVCGGTLRAALAAAPSGLPLEQAIHWIREISEALQAAHGAGIVHRDIKPENILIDHAGHARVSDFGMAFSGQEAATRFTQTGVALGTVGYMAPEQARGMEVDSRADIFSLGVVAYEMLTGRLPQGSFSTARELRPEVPEKLDRFVIAALRPDPERRPAGLVPVIEMLRHVERQPRRSGMSRRQMVAAGSAIAAGSFAGWWWFGRARDGSPAPGAGANVVPAPVPSLKSDNWKRVRFPANPGESAIRGGWKNDGGILESDTDICILPLIREMPAAWMARMRFRRLSGINSVEFFFRTAQGLGSCLLSGWSQALGGVQVVGGVTLMDGPSFTLALTNGRAYEFTIEVRPELVRIWVDGELLLERDIAGKPLTIANPWEWSPGPGAAALGIGSWKSPTRFEWVEWREL